MAEIKRPDLNPNEQDYLLAKVALNHYGLLHEYFIKQMEFYTVACCRISWPGKFKLIPAEKLIVYEIQTEKMRPSKPKKIKGQKAKPVKKISDKKYKEERKIAALNLKTWTKALLSWPDAEVKVMIDGRDEQ